MLCNILDDFFTNLVTLCLTFRTNTLASFRSHAATLTATYVERGMFNKNLQVRYFFTFLLKKCSPTQSPHEQWCDRHVLLFFIRRGANLSAMAPLDIVFTSAHFIRSNVLYLDAHFNEHTVLLFGNKNK
jgi:hypothetical protein